MHSLWKDWQWSRESSQTRGEPSLPWCIQILVQILPRGIWHQNQTEQPCDESVWQEYYGFFSNVNQYKLLLQVATSSCISILWLIQRWDQICTVVLFVGKLEHPEATWGCTLRTSILLAHSHISVNSAKWLFQQETCCTNTSSVTNKSISRVFFCSGHYAWNSRWRSSHEYLSAQSYAAKILRFLCALPDLLWGSCSLGACRRTGGQATVRVHWPSPDWGWSQTPQMHTVWQNWKS